MKISVKIIRLFLIVLFISGCHAPKNLPLLTLPVFDKEGHRGCRGLMPENTIPAMLKALDLGCNTLEMDAVITKDEQVILSHEPFFNHEITTAPNGQFIEENEERKHNIYGMNYAETQQYDVGLKPHPRFPQQKKIAATKPLLGEMIDRVESYCKERGMNPPFYNIETKSTPVTDNIFHPGPEKFVELLMKKIKEKQITRRVIIQSFDFRTLQIVHRDFPYVFTAMLIEEDDQRSFEAQISALGFTPTIYSPAFSLVTEALVKKCRQLNIKIIPWTVNEKSKIEELKKLGVDGIITDFPDLF